MNKNIYQPPKADLRRDEDLSDQPGSPVKAVLIAIVVDIVATSVFIMLLGATIGVVARFQLLTIEEMQTGWLSVVVDPFAWTIGCLISVYCGYLCARIARQNVYRYALVVGLFMMFYGVFTSEKGMTSVTEIVDDSVTLFSVLIGAWWWVRKHPVTTA